MTFLSNKHKENSMNTINLDGRIVTQLNLRKTKQKGISVLNFRLRHEKKQQKNVLFVDIECWGTQAEHVAANAEEGSYVVVLGELRRDVWEKTGENGSAERRSKLKIKAHQITIGDPNDPEDQYQNDGEETNFSF